MLKNTLIVLNLMIFSPMIYANCAEIDQKIADAHIAMKQQYKTGQYNKLNDFNHLMAKTLSQPENIACDYPLSEQSGLKVLYTSDRQAIAFQWDWRGVVKRIDNIVAAKNAKGTVYFAHLQDNENPDEINQLIPANLNGKKHYWLVYRYRALPDFVGVKLWAVPNQMRSKKPKYLYELAHYAVLKKRNTLAVRSPFWLEWVDVIPQFDPQSGKTRLVSQINAIRTNRFTFEYDDENKTFRIPKIQYEEGQFGYVRNASEQIETYQFNGKQFVLDKTE